MTKENRRKLFKADPKRFATYGDEFKDKKPAAKPAEKPAKPKGSK